VRAVLLNRHQMLQPTKLEFLDDTTGQPLPMQVVDLECPEQRYYQNQIDILRSRIHRIS